MEWELIVLAAGIGVAILLFLVFTLGSKGQSYEEAVAANRKLVGLLDDNKQQKRLQQQQTKKNKKAGKKIKEKQAKEQAATSNSEPDNETPIDSGVEEEVNASKHSHHGHVEFIEPTAIKQEEPVKVTKNKKKAKETKVKPILINKDDPSCISDVSTPPSPTEIEPANHFEQIHPKDEFELLHASNEKEKVEVTKPQKDKAAKSGKNKLSKDKEKLTKPALETIVLPEPPKEQRKAKNKVSQVEGEKIEKVADESSVVSSVDTNELSESSMPIEKASKQTVAAEITVSGNTIVSVPDGVQTKPIVQQVIQNVQSAPKPKKKKNELTQYQQLLTCPEGVNVNIMVQLLSEAPLSRSEIQILTDCLLNKQNGPLPEHTEWSEGPKDPLQRLKKQLAEKEKALTDEQEATQAVQAKLKELRILINSERSRCTQISHAAEENANVLRAENTALQTRIQRGIDENNSLRQQVQAKIASESEWAAQRSQMEMHINALTENNASITANLTTLQSENAELREIANELHVAREHSRRLEEFRRLYEEADIANKNLMRSEQMLKQELRQANDHIKVLSEAQGEVQRLTAAHAYSQQEIVQHEQKREELDKQNQQLMADLNKLKSEKEELNRTVNELNEKLVSQPATPNGTTSPDKDDAINIEKAVANACSELEERYSQQIKNMQHQLDQHKDKNNELRTKNWKVMEALQAAEKKLQMCDAQKSLDNHKGEEVTKACLEEQKKSREILQRLFPQISVDCSDNQEWLNNFVEKANKVITDFNANSTALSENNKKLADIESNNQQLQCKLDKYNGIISDMDKTLSKLQDGALEADNKWKMIVAEKEKQFDEFKQTHVPNMQKEINLLKVELENEKKCKDLDIEKVNSLTVTSNKSVDMADIERVLEENARLRENIERLQNETQSLNGPSQLLPITSFDQKARKKRRSLSGWLRRKITFKRKRPKETRIICKRRDLSLDGNKESTTDDPKHYDNSHR